MTLNNKSHLSSSFESLRLVSPLLLIALLTVLSGCSDSGYGEGTLDQEAKDYFKPVSVSVGHDHTCALLKSGIIKCWGKSEYGQIGNISADFSQITPITVSNISTAISSDSVCNYNCAVLSDGTIKCWGEGTNGQLGNGSNDNQTTPVNVSGITTATSVSSTCAVLFDGKLKCWGWGGYGLLGIGGLYTSNIPIEVIESSDPSLHNCAVLSDGNIKCWGQGQWGKLGNGFTSDQYAPVTVLGLVD